MRPTPKFKGMQQLGVFVEGGFHHAAQKSGTVDGRHPKKQPPGMHLKRNLVNDGIFDIYHINQ